MGAHPHWPCAGQEREKKYTLQVKRQNKCGEEFNKCAKLLNYGI